MLDHSQYRTRLRVGCSDDSSSAEEPSFQALSNAYAERVAVVSESARELGCLVIAHHAPPNPNHAHDSIRTYVRYARTRSSVAEGRAAARPPHDH